MKSEISLECCWVQADDVRFVSLSSVVGAIDRESRPQEGGGIAQAIGHVARRCFGTKWYSDVPGEYPRWCDTGNEDIGAATARVARSAKICY